MRPLLVFLLSIPLVAPCFSQGFHAGTGRRDITPEEPIRLAGYASRTHAHEGVEQRLSTKALALKDTAGQTTLIITADTIGTPRWFNDQLAARIAEELSVPREHFLFACTHSHSTPVIDGCLDDMYGLEGEEAARVKRYTAYFLEQCFEAAKEALASSQPVSLSMGRGQAHFAANRRHFGPNGVGFGVNPLGVRDDDVPVLRLARPDGTLLAVLLGYACHCTTPGADDAVCGDWAGFAKEYLESAYPGALAMVMIGCGADQNPEPRTGHAYCRQHGLALAGAVAAVLNAPMRPVEGAIHGAFDRVDLPLGALPEKAYYERLAASSSPATARYGARHVAMLDQGEPLMTSYPCPVQVLRFSKDLTLTALGGEVVVDYAHRLKRELPNENLWVAAYCNDVFAYVPSMRILTEGGYEADDNLIYYGIPTRFSPAAEDLLVQKVIDLVKGASD